MRLVLNILLSAVFSMTINIASASELSELVIEFINVNWNQRYLNTDYFIGWKYKDYGEWNDYNQKYFLRSYSQSGEDFILTIFTHSLPSLSDTIEVITSGSLKYFSKTSEKAKINHDNIINILENNSFTLSNPIDKVYAFGSSSWNNVLRVQGENLSGYTYIDKKFQSSYKENEYQYVGKVPIVLSLKIEDYGNYILNEDEFCYIINSFHIPNRLIHELEQKNITKVLSKENWDKIKMIIFRLLNIKIQQNQVVRKRFYIMKKCLNTL